MNMSSSSSSNSSNNDILPAKHKRYKRALFPDFKPTDVCEQTKKNWEISLQQSGTGISNTAPLQKSDNSSSISLESEHNHDSPLSNDDSVSFVDENNLIDNDDDCSMNAASGSDDRFIDDRSDTHGSQINTDDNRSSIISESDENDRSDEDNDSDNSLENDHESDDSNDDNDAHDDRSFDKIMFESSQLSVRDVIIMISAISLKYHFSDEAKLELANFSKICAGPNFRNMNLSKHKMDKCFSSQKEHISYHFYCSHCSNQIICSVKAKHKIKNEAILCVECKKLNKVSPTSKYYFTEIGLEPQLNQLFSNNLILNDLVRNLIERKNELADGKIRDVHDGLLYKNMMLNENNDDYYILSVNGSTDGAPLSRNGRQNFWGYQMTLNDLSLKLRFRHILLTGIIITEREPNSSLMNLYTSKVFVEPINRLYNKGIQVEYQGEKMLFRIRASNIIADSVARPVIQNRISHSGYYGCSWCYLYGTHIDGHGIHYLNEHTINERTNDSHNADVQLVEYKKQNNVVDLDSKGRKKKIITARGVKGSSVLQKLSNFDMVWSFPYESMHGLFLGVVYQLWGEWRSNDSDYKIKLEHVRDIERRYLSITPTHEIHRLPRSGIVLGKAKPKASELRSWLFLFSLPCLNGILHEDALLHFSKLVKSAYVLSKLEISENELTECERELQEFVESYEVMYGPHRMTFNVHTLLHCTESVRKTGPLPVTSAFPNESKIYELKQYVTGTKGMDKQMSRKHLQSFTFRSGNTKILQASDQVEDYCKKLNMTKRMSTFYETGDAVTFCGRSYLKTIFEIVYLSYKKCIFRGTVYHSIKYERAKKTDDSVVQLRTGEYARVIDILKRNDECYLQLSVIEMYAANPFPPVDHIKRIFNENELECNFFIRPVTDVQCKVILVNARNARYICTLPNSEEIQ